MAQLPPQNSNAQQKQQPQQIIQVSGSIGPNAPQMVIAQPAIQQVPVTAAPKGKGRGVKTELNVVNQQPQPNFIQLMPSQAIQQPPPVQQPSQRNNQKAQQQQRITLGT